ncbi:hypothetical protein AVEN_245260-1 [Araneus ventricosus]|uniref:Uncharacterized protein n=1 Tax=Araneus ventricosus TaxID=182803 RepID=A0A4Y2EFA5_ARAVE|nr:hypothetical protein AVEN_245260-1 [Araneus ventricosus]
MTQIKTDLLKMVSPEKKAQCVLGYVMFLWGFVKDVGYRTKVCNVVALKERIQAAIETVDQGMFLDEIRTSNSLHSCYEEISCGTLLRR